MPRRRPTMHVLYGQPNHLSTSYQTEQLMRAAQPFFEVSERLFADKGTGWPQTQLKRLLSNVVEPYFHQADSDFIFYGNDGFADLRRWKAKSVVYWYDAPWDWAAEPPKLKQTRHWLRYQNIRHADYVFAVSDAQVNVARKLRPGREDSVHYLPVGVDCDFFSPCNKTPSIRQHYKIPSKIIVGYLGYLAQIDDRFAGQALAEVAERLVRAYNIHFLVVGFGRALQTFQQFAAARNLTSHFTFTGYVPTADLPGLIAAMDVCVDTLEPGFHSEARSETKLKQYMAMERACVATAIGENCVDLEHGQCGRLVAPNEGALFEGIAALVDNAADRRCLGAAARTRALSTYDWPVLAKKMATALGVEEPKPPLDQ